MTHFLTCFIPCLSPADRHFLLPQHSFSMLRAMLILSICMPPHSASRYVRTVGLFGRMAEPSELQLSGRCLQIHPVLLLNSLLSAAVLCLATCSHSTQTSHHVCQQTSRQMHALYAPIGRLQLLNTKHPHMIRAYSLSATFACPLPLSHVTVTVISLYRLL